jgi:two-component system response regulator
VVTETILLVEDNPDDAELALLGFAKNAARDISTMNNYRIEVAQSGEAALDYLLGRGKYRGRCPSRNPKLIFLDLKLPGISGLQVLKELRHQPDYSHTPVVILTTSDETSDILESYNLGVNSYLQKPVDFIAFADLLQQVSDYWLKRNITPPATREPLRDAQSSA